MEKKFFRKRREWRRKFTDEGNGEENIPTKGMENDGKVDGCEFRQYRPFKEKGNVLKENGNEWETKRNRQNQIKQRQTKKWQQQYQCYIHATLRLQTFQRRKKNKQMFWLEVMRLNDRL